MTFRHLAAVVSEAADVAERFVDAGHRVYLVGGIVRDLWLDEPIGPDTDLDLTTDARPEQTKAILAPVAEALWLQGERFGTIGAIVGGRPYEVTTHRAESYAAHSRKPDVSYANAIEEDLSRRDFTVNAMAVELPGGTLTDPFGGAADLAAGLLRTPIDADLSFTDDPLRMLRAARFVAGYGLAPTAELVSAMTDLAPRLGIVSAERVRDELDKLLSTPEPSEGLRLMAETGLLERVVPELEGDRLAARGSVLDASESRPDLRWAVLLAGSDPEVVRERLRELRSSNERIGYVSRVLRGAAGVAAGPTERQSYRSWYRQVGADRDDAITVALAVDPSLEAVVGEMEALRRELGGELEDFSLPLGGRDVMEVLGIEEGPLVGEAMAHLDQLRVARGPLDAEAAREALLHWWAARSGEHLR